jgi:hypothetical protein
VSRYNGESTIHAGENRSFVSAPDPSSQGELPDISGWTLECVFTPTDGSTGFTVDDSRISKALTGSYTVGPLTTAETENRAGQRLRRVVRRVDADNEFVLEWDFVNVIP